MVEHGGGGGYCLPVVLFHSEPMHLVQIIIPIESAHLTASYLGDIGLIQFKDIGTLLMTLERRKTIWLISHSKKLFIKSNGNNKYKCESYIKLVAVSKQVSIIKAYFMKTDNDLHPHQVDKRTCRKKRVKQPFKL